MGKHSGIIKINAWNNSNLNKWNNVYFKLKDLAPPPSSLHRFYIGMYDPLLDSLPDR